MLVLLILFLLFGFVVITVLLVPMLIDFLRRDDRVGWWFALPFLLVLPVAFLAVISPLVENDVRGQAMMSAIGWLMVHLVLAGIFLVQGLGLAASRGLRPDGPTRRRRRTSLAAFAGCGLLLLVPWFPGMFSFIWLIPACLAAILWVVAMNRRGPSRLERGKAVSGAMFVAAALQLCFALAHFTLYMDIEAPAYGSFVGSGLLVGLVLCGLVAGLRFLSGPIATLIPYLSLICGLSLPFSMCWFDYPTLPASTQLPAWVDLAGRRGTPLKRVWNMDCVWRLGEEADRSGCSFKRLGVLNGRTPLSDVPKDIRFVVRSGGLRVVGSARQYRAPLRLSERDGTAVVSLRPKYGEKEWVDDEVLPFHALHARLQRELHRPLEVVRSPNWTVQQFVSMCASMGEEAQCKLVD